MDTYGGDRPASPSENRPIETHHSKRRQLVSELRYIFSLFLASRLALTLVGLIAYTFTDTGYGKQFSWAKYRWIDLWGVWDSYWYMDIAQNGYSTIGSIEGSPGQTNFPFFPLYPLLMRFLGNLAGGKYFLAGLVISNVSLLLACYLLYKLVEAEKNTRIARRSVKYLFLFPVSFIFSGVFTESLYLLLTLLCFYLARRQKWWLAGLCGALLSATRTLGVLIALPLCFEYLQSIRFKPRNIRPNSLFLLLVPLGLLGFSIYSYRMTGDFLYFKTNQAAWGREILNPMVVLWNGLRQGLAEGSSKKLIETSFGALTVIMLMFGYKKIGFSYWLLGMYSIIIPLAAGIDSIPRYTLPIFPLFIVFASISRNKAWDDGLTLFLGFLQGCLMLYWCTGQALIV